MLFDEHIAYLVVVVLSAFSIGSVLVTTVLDFKMGGGWRQTARWRGIMKLGYLIVVGTILWVVLPIRIVNVAPATFAYLIGLIVAGIGSLGVTFNTIKFYVDKTVDEEVAQYKRKEDERKEERNGSSDRSLPS